MPLPKGGRAKRGRTLLRVLDSLKTTCPLLIASKRLTLYWRNTYAEVEAPIASIKKVFLKSPKRLRAFHSRCPNIPEPPQFFGVTESGIRLFHFKMADPKWRSKISGIFEKLHVVNFLEDSLRIWDQIVEIQNGRSNMADEN
ncbi:hypothetical protein NQ318_008846 [Aromia moschata]|uniref:Uncharacterized protein n=1 Tax=Aromia moschata TaxID=1265417 RepID=A0AAV8Z9Z9_9CUCU|nr:hypothetical protein NQ318_008846 [Aromia moschata]